MEHTMSDTLLFDLGVQSGTNAALYDANQITPGEFFDENDRYRHIWEELHPESWDPYWQGYNAAYANTNRPEVLAIFQEVKA
jgi:hypothetical protein